MDAMFQPLSSVTTDLSLDDVVARLRASTLVSGIIIFGTAATSLNEASDYDVLVVVDRESLPVRSGMTWISRRLTDLAFASASEVRHLEELTAPILLTDDRRSRLVLWLVTGAIVFDRDGLLARVQAHLRGLPREIETTEEELHRRWDHANYNLAQSARYVAANDETYREAFDLRMTYQLADAMVDYFRVRGLAWQGEKEAIRHWDRADPTFKRLFFACLRESNRDRRFVLYREVVAHAQAPVGGVWPPYSTSVTPGDDGSVDSANRFWLTLLGQPEGR
jgi:hypothetical protein